jgi:uncharacterized membrane protein
MKPVSAKYYMLFQLTKWIILINQHLIDGGYKMKSTNVGKSINVWKIIAIAVIVLFVATIVFGFVKLQRFKHTLADPTVEQIESAEALATKDLEARGFDAEEYTIKVLPKVRGMREAGEDRNIIQVFAESNASRHSYLIDTDSNTILLHSQIEVYGWMAEMDKRLMMPPGSPEAGCGKMEGATGCAACEMKQGEKGCPHEMQGRMPGFYNMPAQQPPQQETPETPTATEESATE